MGSANTSNSSSEHENMNNTINDNRVVLNVYDLTPINNYTYWFGFGIFHTGIEVHGKEYGFGAHDFPVSGVFEVEPRSCPGFIYRSSIPVGRINMTPTDFRTFIENAASEYHGDTYNLISKNCNHFTDDISWRLTGKHIPGWVNRMARLGTFILDSPIHVTCILCNNMQVLQISCTCIIKASYIATAVTLSLQLKLFNTTEISSFQNCKCALCGCLLPESLQATTVKQLPEYHECTEDGTESLSTATPHDSTEIDDMDQEKQLLSPPPGSGEVAFVKETHK